MKIKVHGQTKINGICQLNGSKNATLPLIVAACLTDDESRLENVPTKLSDVKNLVKILTESGADIRYENDNSLLINGLNWKGGEQDFSLTKTIRHSLLLIGLAAANSKNLTLGQAGGCKIGTRKHDFHISALKKLGYDIDETEKGIVLSNKTPEIKSRNITFHYPTFGGTLNAIFASVKLKDSKTLIKNAAVNPEIMETINFLNNCGAKIEVREEQEILIEGVSILKGSQQKISGDRILAATLITAAAITKGSLEIKDFNLNFIPRETFIWRSIGLNIKQMGNNVKINYSNNLEPLEITTGPYPGFHTDIQPFHVVMMSLISRKNSTSIVNEKILDNRFAFCMELNKMGAEIEVKNGDFICVNGKQGQIAKVKQVDSLIGTNVRAHDIRGGAALVVAALTAKGVTTIDNIEQIQRGYVDLVSTLNSIGGNLSWTK